MRSLVVLFLLTLAQAAKGQKGNAYFLDPGNSFHNLYEETQVFIDSLKEFSVSDITHGLADGKFLPASRVPGFPSKANGWLRVEISSKEQTGNWWLILRDSLSSSSAKLDFIELYRAGDTIPLEVNGISVPRSRKSVKMNAGFTGLQFTPDVSGSGVYYVRFEAEFVDEYPVPYAVIQRPFIPQPVERNGQMLVILPAIALIFTALSLFFFFFIRERSYLVFSIYTFTMSQHYLLLHPSLPFIDIYIPEYPELYSPLFPFLGFSSFLVFLWFGRLFTNLKRLNPRTDRMLVIFIITSFCILVFDTIWMQVTREFLLRQFFGYAFLLGTIAFLIRIALLRSTLGYIYVAGAIWLFIFSLLGFMTNSGLTLSFNPWPVGQVGQLLIYGAGLAYKVRLNEKAKAEADRIREMEAMKSRFFANISHEFRTPLTLIQGPLQQVEGLEMGQGNSATIEMPRRHVETIRRNADRLLELVNQLLDLSRLDAGSMKLQVRKGELIENLRQLAAGLEPMAERKQIHYQVHLPEQSSLAWFDKDKLEKIFVNLVANAIKFTPENETVIVEAELTGDKLRLTVSDSGPGIARKDLDRIFDRFYRVEDTDGKGSGIGLALVKELCELCHGQLGVQSEPGKGSRFRVSLPVTREAFTAEELAELESDTRDIQSENDQLVQEEPSLPLLLVVEDHAELRQFIRESLEEHFRIIEASDGMTGFERAIQEIPDIVISDRMMPGLDGIQLTARLKKDERTSHIPIVILTAKAGKQSRIEGLETGADDYVTKPFDANELLARAQNLVSQRRLLRRKFAGEILLKPSEVTSNSAEQVFLEKLMKAIEANLDDDQFGVEELARAVAMSRSQLHRKLVALSNQAPSELLRNTRLLRAKDLLSKKAATPSEVAFMVGFSSHAYFSKCFKEEFGMSPSEV